MIKTMRYFALTLFILPNLLLGIAQGEKAQFKEVTSHLDQEGDVYFYFNPQNWIRALLQKISHETKTDAAYLSPKKQEAEQRNREVMARLIQTSGIEELSGVGMSSIEIEKGMRQNKFVLNHNAQKNTGFLWKIFGEKPHKLDGLNFLPVSTSFAFFMDLNLPLVWSVFQDLGNQGIPGINSRIERISKDFTTHTGLQLEEVLNSLGGEFGIVAANIRHEERSEEREERFERRRPEWEEREERFERRHPEWEEREERFERRRPEWEEREERFERRRPEWEEREERFERRRFEHEADFMVVIKVKNDLIFDWIESKYLRNRKIAYIDSANLKIRRIPLKDKPPIIVARSGDYLFLATSELIVHEALAVQSGKRRALQSTENFKELSKNMPQEGNAFAYCNNRLSSKDAKLFMLFLMEQFHKHIPTRFVHQLMEKTSHESQHSIKESYSVSSTDKNGFVGFVRWRLEREHNRLERERDRDD